MRDDDPFELLGLPRQFDVDPQALQTAYLRRTAALHPDRFTDPIEQAAAGEQAAQLNDARAVLADDEKRANALLRLLGGPGPEQEKTLPDGFLMEMMETRQEMEEAIASGDPDERRRFEQWAADQRTAMIERLRALFSETGHAPDADHLRSLRVELNALRYIERMIEQLDPSQTTPM